MSSIRPGNAPASPSSDIFTASFGKVPDVSLQVAYSEPLDGQRPSQDELKLAFQMLDALLLTTPFDDWEH